MKIDKKSLLKLLKDHAYIKSHVAQSLDVDEATIRRKCKKYKINVAKLRREHIVATLVVPEPPVPEEMAIIPDPIAPMFAKNILVIGDTHEPFTHPDYFDHVRRVRDKHKCDLVVHAGDEVDCHAMSYHESNPNGMSASAEFQAAYNSLQKKWFKEFPNVYCCIGNHTEMIYRKAHTHGIPQSYLKTYAEIWDAPEGWVWDDKFEINGVIFMHGTGKSGKYAPLNWAVSNRQSTVIGHIHSVASVNYSASFNSLIYGCGTGCGIDIRSYAMQYGKHYAERPILSCAVIKDDGTSAIIEPMEM